MQLRGTRRASSPDFCRVRRLASCAFGIYVSYVISGIARAWLGDVTPSSLELINVTKKLCCESSTADFELLTVTNSLACPMDWLKQSNVVPSTMEYYPSIDFTRCVHDYSVLIRETLAPSHSQPATAKPIGRNAPFSPPQHVPIGKYLNSAVTYFVHAAYSGEYEDLFTDTAYTPPNASLWARHMNCAHAVSEWNCLFGSTREHRHGINVISKTESATARIAAKELWKRRRRDLDSSNFLVIIGWIHQQMAPFNSCNTTRHCGYMHVTHVFAVPPHVHEAKTRIYLSLHIRMGDACDERINTRPAFNGDIWKTKRRKCLLPHAYAKSVRDMRALYGVSDILLATDSQEVIEWVTTSMSDFHWHYINFDRSNLKHGKGWIENRRDIGNVEVESALYELDILSRGHVFIGSLCSHFSRAILWSMAGRRNVLPPYMSMDGCSLRNSVATATTYDSTNKTLFEELFPARNACQASRNKPGTSFQRNDGCHMTSPSSDFLST